MHSWILSLYLCIKDAAQISFERLEKICLSGEEGSFEWEHSDLETSLKEAAIVAWSPYMLKCKILILVLNGLERVI